MQIIEKVQVEPTEDTSEEVRQKNYPVDDFPLWSKKDNPTSILEYVRMLRSNGDKITLEEFVRTLPDSPSEMPTRRAKKTTSKPSDPKGKGILIEEPKRKKAASKSVVIRESVPEPSPERTPEESYEESQSYSSESPMDSSSGTQEEEVPPRRNVKRKAIIEESSDEETEDDIPLVKRQRIQKAQVQEEVEQDDCEIIENVLQVIRESAEGEESTDSDIEPIGKTLKLPLKGPLQKKESGP
ncbi:uncharacterized protein LOC130719118 [Lotus japonicus]|uniref:uncharacterized protein LOC130719118 n=1 Tax=Lotus japonicus TaxID=34305 RepID=UPI002583AE0F|nr:uncharacterized protein LOC130719118 [Lotus japonicus]